MDKVKIYLILLTVLLFHAMQIDGGSSRIIGGYEAPISYSKFHASLQNWSGAHVCGGAVISIRHVITAAHCVYGAQPKYITVVIGTTNLDFGGKQYNISCIKVHQEFNFSQKTHDIAIVKVKNAFDLQLVNILKLDNKALNEGDAVAISGFGSPELDHENNRQMYVLNISVFNQETCKYAMRNVREVKDHMFCTFTSVGQGTCHGDSGGPVIKGDELVGIVSWGIPCAVGFPDVHTRITPYIEWIQRHIRKYLP